MKTKSPITGATRNPFISFIPFIPFIPFILFILFILFIFFSVPSCSDPVPSSRPGAIMFTSDRDCEFRLFNSDSIQIARATYEPPKHPIAIYMSETGIFFIHAESGAAVLKKTLTYAGGNMEYFIEF